MKLWVSVLLFLSVFAACFAATTPVKKKGSAKKSASSGKSSRKRKAVKSSGGPSSRQLTPTPERYKEIQQALVSKGYLHGEPSGVWDSQSTDAMRHFQSDKKIDPSGKINSPSLIGLGLGPKTASNANATPAVVEPPAPITESAP